jgi:hypothetical protein
MCHLNYFFSHPKLKINQPAEQLNNQMVQDTRLSQLMIKRNNEFDPKIPGRRAV